ncbi:MAG: DUF2950 domain-containing protein [Rhodovulum sulfidophilum]|uniref:DUF2950 domain-containing protein n=1 Tax=Rhodovulum sulfidophilum TaxID=35806 RepID=A0A2W5NFL8_RHOSU|nr:MAG: DUF2950 domain-containing protein [Rhodovulum sulfidophilum]
MRAKTKDGLGAALALSLLAGPGAADPAVFATPEAAAEAVVAALEARDPEALIAVFGPENADVALTGDPVEDRETWGAFLRDYRALRRIDIDGDTATLVIGRDLWPVPAPLVRGADGWHFDAAAAREEVRLRRIGRNELDVIDLMRGYDAAQTAYRAMDPDGDGLPTFAATLISSPGARDGLYWPDAPGTPESPVGDFMARAAAEGYSIDGGADAEPDPYLGYYFHILTRQGPAAPGGAMDYMVGGHMVAGHALIAFPSDYGESGVTSFLVGERGVVYEADLGPDTLAIASAIDSFDPGAGWTPVADDD